MEELHLFIINPHAGKGKEQAVLPERIRAAAQELMNLGMPRSVLAAMLEELEQEGSHD